MFSRNPAAFRVPSSLRSPVESEPWTMSTTNSFERMIQPSRTRISGGDWEALNTSACNSGSGAGLERRLLRWTSREATQTRSHGSGGFIRPRNTRRRQDGGVSRVPHCSLGCGPARGQPARQGALRKRAGQDPLGQWCKTWWTAAFMDNSRKAPRTPSHGNGAPGALRPGPCWRRLQVVASACLR